MNTPDEMSIGFPVKIHYNRAGPKCSLQRPVAVHTEEVIVDNAQSVVYNGIGYSQRPLVYDMASVLSD